MKIQLVFICFFYYVSISFGVKGAPIQDKEGEIKEIDFEFRINAKNKDRVTFYYSNEGNPFSEERSFSFSLRQGKDETIKVKLTSVPDNFRFDISNITENIVEVNYIKFSNADTSIVWDSNYIYHNFVFNGFIKKSMYRGVLVLTTQKINNKYDPFMLPELNSLRELKYSMGAYTKLNKAEISTLAYCQEKAILRVFNLYDNPNKATLQKSKSQGIFLEQGIEEQNKLLIFSEEEITKFLMEYIIKSKSKLILSKISFKSKSTSKEWTPLEIQNDFYFGNMDMQFIEVNNSNIIFTNNKDESIHIIIATKENVISDYRLQMIFLRNLLIILLCTPLLFLVTKFSTSLINLKLDKLS